MIALLLSTLLLAIAPLVAVFIEKRAKVFHFLDGFVLVAIGGLCVLHLLPEILPKIGLWAFLLLGLGALLPYWAEHKLEGLGHAPERVVLILALLALLFHAMLDGLGLQISDENLKLAIPVVAHRFPVGLFLWWTIGSNFGKKWGVLALSSVAGATILGYVLGQNIEPFLEGESMAWIQCLLVGSLLHILFHQPAIQSHKPSKMASAFGAVFGICLTIAINLIPGTHDHDHHGEESLDLFFHTTETLFIESSGPILLGFLGAGLLMTFGSDKVAKAMKGKSRLGSATRGVVYGLPLPICSCGVVPLYKTLISKGAPPSAALAFLIATPELGLDAVLLSFPLLGADVTIARIIAAFVIALIVGVFIGGQLEGKTEHNDDCANKSEASPHDHSHEAHHKHEDEDHDHLPKDVGLIQALRYAFIDMVDHLGPWIVAGIVAAALLQPLLGADFLSSIPAYLQIIVTVLVSAPGYVCASAATPIAAILLINGLSPGAVLAFLIAGPATNLTTFGMLKDTHGFKSAVKAIAAIVGLSIGLGFIVNAVIPPSAIQTIDMHAHEPALYEQIAAIIFAGLLLFSIFRTGPRGFLTQLGLSDIHQHQHGAMLNEEPQDDCDKHCHHSH
ncbi:MAG: permease [Planctomycetota bacterium]|nr:permease [Planctomycetota bacterium]